MTPTEAALMHAEEQLGGALQIIAALVLTDEEVIAAKLIDDPDALPANLVGWAEEMRRDLLSRRNRPQVVALLTRLGFLTNTDAEYPLRGLDGPSPQIYAELLTAIQGVVDEFVAGRFGDLPPLRSISDRKRQEALQVFFRDLVGRELASKRTEIERSYTSEDIDYAMLHWGYQQFLMARVHRLMRS